MNRRHVVRIQGGLGNQLFQWAFGMALAQRTGATVYHGIDFFAQAPGEHVPRALELSVFGLSPRPAPADVLEGIHRRDTRWNGWSQRLWPGLLAPPIVCERKPYTYDEAMFAQRADTLFDGYWQTERYFLPIAAEVREAFTFQHPMPSGVEQQADAIRSSMAVALHVRRGDYTYHAAASSYFATCEPAYYQQAMAHMLERVPDVRFFVFSDDPAWARANLPKLAPMTFVEGNTGDRGPEDLRLMTLCRHHIIANSSFSWWGAWLAARPGQQVVAPARWLRDPVIPTPDLIPAGWHRL